MPARLAKAVAVLLMGLGIICQELASSTTVPGPVHEKAVTCCAKGCTNCGSASCCAASSQNRTPTTPAPQRSAEDLQAINPPTPPVSALAPSALDDFFSPAASAAPQDGTVPIFQRNCSFLI